MTPEDAAKTLRDWSLNNPRAPEHWHIVSLALANHSDMPTAWKELLKLTDSPNKVAALVRSAYEHALKEVGRGNEKKESKDLENVMSLCAQLQQAIKDSSLPEDTAIPVFGDWDLWAAYKTYHDDIGDFVPGAKLFKMTQFLDYFAERVKLFSDNRPMRATARDRGKVLIDSFVRWLSWNLEREFNTRAMHATIGRLVTAVLNLPNPLDRRNVERILKNNQLTTPIKPLKRLN